MTATATCEMIANCKPWLVWALQPQADSDCSWLGAVGLEQALEKELPGLPCRGQPTPNFLNSAWAKVTSIRLWLHKDTLKCLPS